MCNAWNHTLGCNCGFGESSQGVGYLTGRSEWPDDVQEMPRLLERGLRDLGWSSTEIAEFAHTVDGDVTIGAPGLATRIRRALTQYRLEEIDARTETIEVPLFRFAAPQLSGARVVYREAEATSSHGGLSLQVLGVGTGASATLQVERTATYVAEAGDCKVVTVPVRMRVARVQTFQRNRFVSEGVRAEVITPKAGPRQLFRRRGCRSLRAQGCLDPGAGSAEDQIAYDFTSDDSGALHDVERSWRSDYVREVSLRFRGPGSAGPLVRSFRRSEVTLALKLPAGHDYRASIFRDRLWWEAPAPEG